MRVHLLTFLFAIAVFYASVIGFDVLGLFAAMISLIAVFSISALKRKRRSVMVTSVIVASTYGFFLLLMPACINGRDVCHRSWCLHNIKQISFALHNYHSKYGSFPPAYVPDEHGKPMHSWRVLILPYMEGGELYEQYDFSEPWNGPNNSKLAAERSCYYVCPSADYSEQNTTTNYLAVVGPRTAWPGSKTTTFHDFHDGVGETILLVEAVDSGIHWMEPRDISFEQAIRGINRESGLCISSRHNPYIGLLHRDVGACVAFADGGAKFVSKDLPSTSIEALLTIDGGETIFLNPLDARRLDRTKCLSLIILTVSLVLLIALRNWNRSS